MTVSWEVRCSVTGVPQGWTLTVEECFYFTAPLIFLLWRRWQVKTRWILVGLYGIGVALWGIGSQLDLHGLFSPFKFVVAYTYFGHALSFLAGAWLGRSVLVAELVPPRLPANLSMTACGASAIVLLTLALSTGQSASYAFGVVNPPYLALAVLAYPPAICLLIAGLVSESTWISRVLGSALLVLLGKASYCFYLIHLGFMQGYFHKLLPKAWGKDRYSELFWLARS